LGLLRVNLLRWHNLRMLTCGLRMLQLRWLLGGCTSGLMLLEVLAVVRLRLRLLRELLLLILDAVRRTVLWRVRLVLLVRLLLWMLVVVLLLLGCSVWAWSMQLSVS